jgi:hypothetical protein
MVEGEEEVAAEDIVASPRLRDETSLTEAGQRDILSEEKLHPRSESLSKSQTGKRYTMERNLEALG